MGSLVTIEYTPENIQLMKDTVCKGSTDQEFMLFLHACRRFGLDPLMRQIHAVPRFNSSTGRNSMTIQTSIDGYRLIAERTGCYAPGRESIVHYDDNKNIVSATAFVKKMTKDGTWHEIASTAKFNEYAQRKKDGTLAQFWAKMPEVMICKCAESLALRRAFPAELSGLYTREEMAQADNPDIDSIETLPEVMNIDDILDTSPARRNCLQMIKNLPENVKDSFAAYLQKEGLDHDLVKANKEQLKHLESRLKHHVGQ